METKIMKFWSLGCSHCGGLQLGRDTNGTMMEYLPIFHTKELAQMEIGDNWQTAGQQVAHPPMVIEIEVKVVV